MSNALAVQSMTCSIPLGEVTRNVGSLFLSNRRKFGERDAFAERTMGGDYVSWTWDRMVGDILRAADFLQSANLAPGERVGFVSTNSYARLVCEMAAMSGGWISVPVFPGYPRRQIRELLDFAKVKAVFAENEELATALTSGSGAIAVSLGEGVRSFGGAIRSRELGPSTEETLVRRFADLAPDTLALVMYTSGTSGMPKGVQLTHRNLMSQQRALELLWKPEPGMKFLCYLPWHHSFGGLFERFFALHSGGCLAIDDSWGKDVSRLLLNFKDIQPNVYFSVPKIYQEIVSRILADREVEKTFFHPGLKFVFTAAAPLPASTSEIFRAKGVPVVEGWGLTETSPCCTLTERSLERFPGVVGFPIPGVEIRLGEESEILVQGPNVMRGYLDRPEETSKALDADGWFHTGDIGEITPSGLKLVSRKDRMFKLSNGEKIFPSVVEERIRARCRYVKHAYVWGSGLPQPHALVFANTELYGKEEHSESGDCSYPECSSELAACLSECIRRLNDSSPKIERVRAGVVVEREPTIEGRELTPSFKLIPRAIEQNYANELRAVERGSVRASDGHFIQAEQTLDLHYGVIGLGPIGAVLAAHLRKAGRRVSLLCPNPGKREDFSRSPLTVAGMLEAEVKFDEVHADLPSFLRGRPDVVLVATKSCDSPVLFEKIREELAASAHGYRPVFISCQNGLDVEEQISRVFGPKHALRLVLNVGCRFVGQGKILTSFAYTNYLSLREVTGGAEVPRAIASDLTAGGFKVVLRADYRAEVFRKAILNASLSPVCAIAGVTMKAAMTDPDLLEIVKCLLRESIAVAEAAGIHLRPGYYEKALSYLSRGGEHKPSMLMDIERGRMTENEDHCGRIARYGRELGIAVPVTETVYRLVRGIEGRFRANEGGSKS